MAEHLRTSGPVKNTVHNLTQVLSVKLDTLARLDTYQEDARNDVDDEAQQIFGRLAEAEIEQVREIMDHLGRHLTGQYGDPFAPPASRPETRDDGRLSRDAAGRPAAGQRG